MLRMSRAHQQSMLALPRNQARWREFEAEAEESLQAQRSLEAKQRGSFEEYLAAYLAPHGSYALRDTQIAMMLYGAVFLGMSAGFGGMFEWTLHGERTYQRLPTDKHWAARARFVGGGLVYVIAIVVGNFNADAAFVIIALVAVYYIVERKPDAYKAPAGDASADPGGPDGSGGE